MITGDSSIGISSTQYSGYEASSFSTSFSPGLDVFVLRGLSIGVDVDARYSSTGGELLSTTSSGLAGGPRLGFNVTLGRLVSWYPRVTVGGESLRREVHDSNASTFDTRATRSTYSGVFVSAFAPLLLHPRPHFFVPGFDYFVGAGVSLGMSVTASLDQRSGSERDQFSGTVVTVGLYAPLLVHFAPHAFAGFGPLVAHEALHTVDGRLGGVLATRIGASLVVGGWL